MNTLKAKIPVFREVRTFCMNFNVRRVCNVFDMKHSRNWRLSDCSVEHMKRIFGNIERDICGNAVESKNVVTDTVYNYTILIPLAQHFTSLRYKTVKVHFSLT